MSVMSILLSSKLQKPLWLEENKASSREDRMFSSETGAACISWKRHFAALKMHVLYIHVVYVCV